MISSRCPRPMGTMASMGLRPGHHRLVDGATGQDTGGLQGGTTTLSSFDRAFAVDGGPPRASTTRPRRPGSDRNIDNLTSPLDGVTLLDETIVTEDGDTDIVGFQVQAHAHGHRKRIPPSLQLARYLRPQTRPIPSPTPNET